MKFQQIRLITFTFRIQNKLENFISSLQVNEEAWKEIQNVQMVQKIILHLSNLKDLNFSHLT